MKMYIRLKLTYIYYITATKNTDKGKNEVPMENRQEDAAKKDLEVSNNPEDCIYCDNHPYLIIEAQAMLVSILHTNREWKTNKQVRFLIYAEATKLMHGAGLGVGNT